MDEKLLSLSKIVGQALLKREYSISCAESCTGGLLSQTLTAISGSSDYFIGGVVAYSNRIKEEVLGVQRSTLERYGAVSQQTAQEMADGVRLRLETTIGLSTTGIAGPTGGTAEKPVGLVCLGISLPEKTWTYACQFTGDRLQVMHSSVVEILERLLKLL
jgi:PncC family amidohydrolase